MADVYVVDPKTYKDYPISMAEHILKAAGIDMGTVNVRGVYENTGSWLHRGRLLGIQMSVGYGRSRVMRRVMAKEGKIELVALRIKHAELDKIGQERALRGRTQADKAKIDNAIRVLTAAELEGLRVKHKSGRGTWLQMKVSEADPKLGNLALLQLTPLKIDEILTALEKAGLI